MKLTIYGLKNRLSGMFERPQAETVTDSKDYVEFLTANFAANGDPATLARYAEYDVYKLGDFETKTGEIVSCCDFIASLGPICEQMIAVKTKKVENNVGETA